MFATRREGETQKQGALRNVGSLSYRKR